LTLLPDFSDYYYCAAQRLNGIDRETKGSLPVAVPTSLGGSCTGKTPVIVRGVWKHEKPYAKEDDGKNSWAFLRRRV